MENRKKKTINLNDSTLQTVMDIVELYEASIALAFSKLKMFYEEETIEKNIIFIQHVKQELRKLMKIEEMIKQDINFLVMEEILKIKKISNFSVAKEMLLELERICKRGDVPKND